MPGPPPTETERLVLRPLAEADVPWLIEMDTDPDVMRYVTATPTEPDPEQCRAWVRGLSAKYGAEGGGRYGFFAGVEKASGEAIGWLVLRPAPDYKFAESVGFRTGELELGYRLRRRFWGRGYATEGARALVRVGFADPTVRAVAAVALAANRASTRVMEKCGLTYEREWALPGFPDPAVTYRLTRARFAAASSAT
jgi:RimJ/RimL family protein N-acetyltransferase